MAHTHTEETEAKKLEPTCTTQEVGPCRLKLTITVAAEKVKELIEDKYKDLNDGMALPGFRKGHAPRPLLERKFGKQVLDEVKYDLLTKSFEETKEAKELTPLGEPDLDVEKIELKPDQAFTYDITVEIQPQIALKRYTGIEVKKVPATVTDKDIDERLLELQETRAEWVPVEGGISKPEDQVVADFSLIVADKAMDSSENNALSLNEHISFYGLELKEYYKALCDKKVGDVVEYAVKLPETWHDKTVAGKDATIRCTIKSIKRSRLPELSADFAKAFDMDSVDELRDHWRKRIEREKEREARSAMADQVLDAILKENEFPLPEGLLKSAGEEALRRLETRLILNGMNEEEAAVDAAKQATESKDSLARSLRERFVLEHVGNKEKIYVTEDQVEERIQQIAQRTGKWPHELRNYLEQEGLMTNLRRGMREEAIKEFLLTKAAVKE